MVYRNHAKSEKRSIIITQYDTRFEVHEKGMFISVGSTQCLGGDKHLKEFWRQSNQFSLLITETQAQKYNIIHDQKF